MNLDELQIKISIELDDLNKQLKTITKSIDNTLGPKATKKLMADNNKIIKSGLTAINKTTLNLVKKSRVDTTREIEAMSKDINKSLTKAFDINLTKFNSNITSAMNQARTTVRSVCNDIRRELNAALNINSNIRVTSKTSITGSANGSTDSNVASNMASSQYIGAMIIKATNAIIANNNANTRRLEQTIDGLANKLALAIKKINPTIKTDPNNTIQNSTSKVEDPLTSITKVTTESMESFGFELRKTGEVISAITKDMVNAHKAFVIINRNLNALNSLKNIKQLATGYNAYGYNNMQGGTVNWRQGRKDQTIPSFKGEIIDPETIVKSFEQLQNIIEITNYKIKDFETALVKMGNRAVSIAKTLKDLKLTTKGAETLTGEVVDDNRLNPISLPNPKSEPIEITDFKVIDDELEEQINEAIERIKQVKLPLNSDSFGIDDIKKKIQEITEEFETTLSELSNLDVKALEDGLMSLKDWIPYLEEVMDTLNQLDKDRINLNIDTTDAQNNIEALKASYEMLIEACKTNNLNAIRDLFPQGEEQTNSTGKKKYPSKPANGFGNGSGTSKNKGGKPPKPTIMGFGFGAYKNEIDTLIEYAKKAGAKIRKALKVAFNPVEGPAKLHLALIRMESKAVSIFNNIRNKAKNIFSKIATPLVNAFNKVVAPIKNIANKIIAPIKSAISRVSALTKNYGVVIKTHLNKAFTGIKSSKLYTSVSTGLNKAKGAVSKFSSKVKPILNKAFDGIKVGAKVASTIAKGLGKAKKALNKFASGCKTIWSKIKQIFSKGAKDASNATGKLTSGLKGLLSQAFGFFSIYGLINLGREAITQSQTLAQSEIKLTSLMKQRMGATNDTVTAIRQLVEEQANLGVVSKTALTRGAEQLSMYVHSAKALKDLMPAIANLTAKRGGFMATEDDAEEIATQLGEAIREGTTTPLEQSGIYLSEAEIKKFSQLRTEEERAAYLANVIAQNVGNINQALANTPIGAMTQLKNNFKELLSTLGIFLANVLKPIVQWLNTIVVACNNALKALGKLLGFDMTGGATSVGDIGTGGGSTEIDTGGVDSATDSYNDAADAADKATEANEKFKGSLMGFDEINVLSDNTSSDSGSEDEYDPTDITPGEGGQLIPEVGELTEADSIFSKFSDKMKAFMDEILEPFKNAWDLLGDRWKAEWGDLLKSFEHFCTSLATFLKSVWEHGGKEFVQHFAEIVLAVGIAAMEIGGEILDSLARLWEHLDPSKNMNTQGFLDALNEVSVKLRDFILGLGDHFESFMANGGQDLLNAFGDMAMNIGEAIVRGFGVGIDALDGLIDHLDPANNPKTKNMLKSWESAFGSIGDMALSFVGLLESTLENGGQEIINSLGDLGVDIGAAIGVVVDEVAKAFAELFDHMDPAKNQNSKDMLKSFDGLVDSIDKFVVAATKLFKKFMDAGGREFIKNLGDIVAIVLDLAAAIGSGVIDLITGFMNSWVGQAMIEACAKALEWFSEKLEGLKDIIEPLKDVFQDVVDFIVGIFEGDGEKVGRAFVSFIKNALKVGFELSKFMAEIGEALILGLIEGIKALPGLLWECIKFIFDFIVGIFKELFGIHSPSTVFRDLGINLMEGLIEGIESLITAIGDVFTNIKEAVVGWVQDIVGGAVEKWGELKESITTNLGELKETVSTKWQEIKENVSEKCKEIFDDTKDKWTNIKDKTIEIASDLKEKAEEKYTQLKDKLTDTTDKWRQNSEDKWSKVKSKTEELTTNLKNTVEDKYSKFRDKLTDTMENWRSNNEDKWNKIKNKTSELVSNLKSDTETKYNTMKENLTSKLETWRSTSESKWNDIKEKGVSAIENIRKNGEEKFESLKTAVTTKMETIKTDVVSKWETVKNKTSEIVNNLKSDVEKKYNDLKTNIGAKLEEVKSEAISKWENIKSTTVSKVRDVVDEATKKFGEMKSSFTSKMDEVKTALGPKWTELKNSVKTNAQGIGSKISEGLSNVKQKFTKPFEDAQTAIKNIIDGIGRYFKNASWSLPKLKMPHLSISGSFSLNPPSVPKFSVEWYKRGGIIDGITPLGFANGSLHMGGEAGKEMVVPLENTSFTSKIAQAMGQAVDNAMARNMNGYYGSSYNVIDDNRDIVLKINDREFARASINSINKLQRESGRTLLDI